MLSDYPELRCCGRGRCPDPGRPFQVPPSVVTDLFNRDSRMNRGKDHLLARIVKSEDSSRRDDGTGPSPPQPCSQPPPGAASEPWGSHITDPLREPPFLVAHDDDVPFRER